MPVKPKTLEKVVSFTGDHSVACTLFATMTMQRIKMLANKPDKTTELAFFLPYISEIISVTKKVIGYGMIPAEISKV